MPRTILCSTGTSIATGTKAGKAYQSRPSAWDDDTTELAGEIAERLKALDLSAEDGRVKASAELNALHRLRMTADDEVVFFVTDTADGRCCAEAVRQVLVTHFDIRRVTIERIDGLQVRDSDALRKTGLINLTRRLIYYLDDPQRRYGGGCVLNTNGGFKGIVPFFAILGMIFRAPVVYVFEFAECLINLPPLPLGFAADLFEQALPALTWARSEGVFAPEDFYRRVPGLRPEEMEWFETFLETASDSGAQTNLASLSPLASVLAQREAESSVEIRLSQEALKRYQSLVGPLRDEVDEHLRKLTSPLWRGSHRDAKHTSDLEFYPRGHNPWRFAGWTGGRLFHLCWFTNQKSEYLDWIATRTRGKYADSEFSQFELPPVREIEGMSAGESGDKRSWAELYQENLGLTERAEELDRRNRELERDDAILRKNYRDELARSQGLRSQLDRLRKGK